MNSHFEKGFTALFLACVVATSLPDEVLAQSASSSSTTSFVDTVIDSARQTWSWGRSFGNSLSILGSEKVSDLKVPVVGVKVSQLYDSWGDGRSGGRSHEGIDIMAARGTPIVSPTKAIVSSIGFGANGGNYVYTINPGGERFYYAHLDSYAEGLTEGKVLEAGDLIGHVGNSGNASGGAPHLHFGIYQGGASNPYPRFTKEFTMEETISLLNKMVATASNKEAAAYKLTPYRSILIQASQKGITLESTLTAALGITSSPSETKSATFALYRDLKLGSQGEDVRMLQKFLNTHGATIAVSGPGSAGNETAYFGPATRNALATYQRRQGIVPAAGYFGPLTRSTVTLELGGIAAR